MAKLKPIKDEKELAAVPLDEPVLVELEPAATGAASDAGDRGTTDTGAANLEKQLEASQEAERRSNERAEKAERAEREAREESDRLKSAGADTEKELLNNSLASAQADEAAAKAAFETAFDAGDAKAMADAQSKIGRAAARVLNFEGAVAELDEQAKAAKENPRQEPQVDLNTAIDRDPKLMPKERDWLKAHPEVLTDGKKNTELTVGYNRALAAGHKRGTDAYFQYLDEFLGYAEPSDHDDDGERSDERASIMSAPVTRDSRSSLSGRPNAPTRITLSPEQREMARSMGLTDVQYAKGQLQLDANKKSDPERFARRS